ncbi:peptidase, M16 family protein [Echinicola strongylocentroti]|uniref:Peptidase, M16 family protein n=1 Tax=Echinicola strongylocentroti TaxID=1795355 RepID=A0A2Z4IKR4_9BACT|nr:peptidase, M16 family protein [Echinicola strongylocentroti]AWW31309.1 peptidase, M16 family protein [Echinicola strongylocentroti]
MKKAMIALVASLMMSGVDVQANEAVKKGSLVSIQDVTVKEVVDKYISAAGGIEKIKAIKNMEMNMETEIQGMTLVIKAVTDQENHRLLNLTKMNGNQVAKTVIRDNQGKVVSMGQEQDLTEDQLNSMKSQTFVFPELFYEELGYEVTYGGTEDVEGEAAHKLLLKDASGVETSEFYSVESGLKLKTASEAAGTVSYKDYQEVDGIMVPSKMVIANSMMPTAMEANITSVVFNQELDSTLFEW